MNRNEALRLLGLSADATSEEVKAAYRETAQILHPDRFASNKKLQERATEQFKNLQEAYEVLTRGKASSARARGTVASSAEEAEINARLAGISAARKQLLTQRDVALDERRSGFAMAGIGALVALAVWGIVKVVSAQKTASILNDHLDELAAEKKQLLARLDEIG